MKSKDYLRMRRATSLSENGRRPSRKAFRGPARNPAPPPNAVVVAAAAGRFDCVTSIPFSYVDLYFYVVSPRPPAPPPPAGTCERPVTSPEVPRARADDHTLMHAPALPTSNATRA